MRTLGLIFGLFFFVNSSFAVDQNKLIERASAARGDHELIQALNDLHHLFGVGPIPDAVLAAFDPAVYALAVDSYLKAHSRGSRSFAGWLVDDAKPVPQPETDFFIANASIFTDSVGAKIAFHNPVFGMHLLRGAFANRFEKLARDWQWFTLKDRKSLLKNLRAAVLQHHSHEEAFSLLFEIEENLGRNPGSPVFLRWVIEFAEMLFQTTTDSELQASVRRVTRICEQQILVREAEVRAEHADLIQRIKAASTSHERVALLKEIDAAFGRKGIPKPVLDAIDAEAYSGAMVEDLGKDFVFPAFSLDSSRIFINQSLFSGERPGFVSKYILFSNASLSLLLLRGALFKNFEKLAADWHRLEPNAEYLAQQIVNQFKSETTELDQAWDLINGIIRRLEDSSGEDLSKVSDAFIRWANRLITQLKLQEETDVGGMMYLGSFSDRLTTYYSKREKARMKGQSVCALAL